MDHIIVGFYISITLLTFIAISIFVIAAASAYFRSCLPLWLITLNFITTLLSYSIIISLYYTAMSRYSN